MSHQIIPLPPLPPKYCISNFKTSFQYAISMPCDSPSRWKLWAHAGLQTDDPSSCSAKTFFKTWGRCWNLLNECVSRWEISQRQRWWCSSSSFKNQRTIITWNSIIQHIQKPVSKEVLFDFLTVPILKTGSCLTFEVGRTGLRGAQETLFGEPDLNMELSRSKKLNKFNSEFRIRWQIHIYGRICHLGSVVKTLNLSYWIWSQDSLVNSWTSYTVICL